MSDTTREPANEINGPIIEKIVDAQCFARFVDRFTHLTPRIERVHGRGGKADAYRIVVAVDQEAAAA